MESRPQVSGETETTPPPEWRKTLVDLVRWRAQHQRDTQVFSFLSDGARDEVSLTFGQLDDQARCIARLLHRQQLQGGRVLLLYPPGLSFITALFGCFYAGVVAVPVYPLRKERGRRYLQTIVADAEISTVLTTSKLLKGARRTLAEGSPTLTWLTTDDLEDQATESPQRISVEDDTIAYLQYTSGSTQAPRGVMVSHRNLMHNLDLIEEAFGTTPESRGISWLPPYHDLGLVGGLFQPLHVGFPCVLMSPAHFMRSPMRWLQLISDRRLTITGAPNFAYELCARSATAEDLRGLDLSSWQLALNGAEPVRAETLARFAEVFEPCGFRAKTLYPGYGLAEATLMVTGGSHLTEPVVGRFDARKLEQHQAVEVDHEDTGAETSLEKGVRNLVGCGRARSDLRLLIVDPESGDPVADGRVGEVLIAGESVALGYWNRPEATREVFQGRVSGFGAQNFLRTGDLGFLRDGELFVTGRRKDLIILRGRNFYPQDIESLAAEAHPALPAGRGAAFTLEVDGEEELVVVHEVDRTHREDAQVGEILRALNEGVAKEYPLRIYALFLLDPGGIPRTPNGKIQRQACRSRLLAGDLEVIAWQVAGKTERAEALAGIGGSLDRASHKPQTHAPRPPRSHLERDLARIWCDVLEVEEVGLHDNFFDLGGDSQSMIRVQHRIETELGLSLPVIDLFRLATLGSLATHLAGRRTDPTTTSNARQRVANRSAALGRQRRRAQARGRAG